MIPNLIKSSLFISLILITQSCEAQMETVKPSIGLKEWKTVKKENSKFWSVTDSLIVGGDGVTKIPTNTYLHTVNSYGDFELRLLFKITGDHDLGLINSGIQYRSIIENNRIIGYQADIGKAYWGDIYDEHRRGKLVSGDLNTLKHILNNEGWNSYIIRCKGNTHQTYINGVKTAHYIEKDLEIPSEGVIGIQVHKGGNAMIEIKNITITEL